MRLIALLSWFDESPVWLAELVASLASAGVDHIVALDGAYGLYRPCEAWSGTEQHDAILHTARGCGLGCTIHVPQRPWDGNEVAKRTALFAYGDLAAEPGDWLWVADADEVVTSSGDTKRTLEQTSLDVAEVLLWERMDWHSRRPEEERAAVESDLPERSQTTIRKLFRAGLGIRVSGNHYTYVTADGRVLWGMGRAQEEAVSVLEVKIEHRNRWRAQARTSARNAYYERRDIARVER